MYTLSGNFVHRNVTVYTNIAYILVILVAAVMLVVIIGICVACQVTKVLLVVIGQRDRPRSPFILEDTPPKDSNSRRKISPKTSEVEQAKKEPDADQQQPADSNSYKKIAPATSDSDQIPANLNPAAESTEKITTSTADYGRMQMIPKYEL